MCMAVSRFIRSVTGAWHIEEHINRMETRIMAKLDELVAAETAEKASEDQLIALLTSVSQQLSALKDSGGATDTQLQGVIDTINANTATMNAAIAADTPPPATPPVTPPAAPAPDVTPTPPVSPTPTSS